MTVINAESVEPEREPSKHTRTVCADFDHLYSVDGDVRQALCDVTLPLSDALKIH